MKTFTKVILGINFALLIAVLFFAFGATHNTAKADDFLIQQVIEIHPEPAQQIDNEIVANIIFSTVKEIKASNSLIEPNYDIEFTPEVEDQLNQYWNQNTNREFGVCADGYMITKENNKKYMVNKIYAYRTGEESSIASIECDSALGTIHSHPQHTAQWSNADKNAFKDYNKDNLNKIMIIMYNTNKFIVYDSESLIQESLNLGKLYSSA